MIGNPIGLGKNLDSIACREHSKTIIKSELEKHQREAAAWQWLSNAIKAVEPNEIEESGLWDLLNRARRERF